MKKISVLFFVLVLLGGSALAQTLLMNEIYSRGVTGDPDWIEIYNPTNNAVTLTGYKIYDNGGQANTKPKKLFPAGISIPGKSFYVIVTDVADSSGFGLSSGGEKVWLENPAGGIIDSVTFPAMGTTESYRRMPDGGPWALGHLSRGMTNSPVVMNEIYSRGVTADPDWIELYNMTSSAIDVGGWKIYDNGGQAGTKPKKLLPAGTNIPANGFFVIVTDVADSSGFGLSSGGETVWFENALGVILDSIAFPALGIDTSYGRKPNGGPWMKTSPLTKGTSNVPTGVKDKSPVEMDFTLFQNYPNPFNPSTTITFNLNTASTVTLSIFDNLGREVKTLLSGYHNAGNYTVLFDASGLANGVYFYRLAASASSVTKKLILLK